MPREITFRFDSERMDALTKLAAEKSTTVEQLAKVWVADRLRSELLVRDDCTTAALQRQLAALEEMISRLVPDQKN